MPKRVPFREGNIPRNRPGAGRDLDALLGKEREPTPALTTEEQRELDKKILKSAVNGDLNQIKELSGQGGNIHAVDNDGWTIGHPAALNNHQNILEWLRKQEENYKKTTPKE